VKSTGTGYFTLWYDKNVSNVCSISEVSLFKGIYSSNPALLLHT